MKTKNLLLIALGSLIFSTNLTAQLPPYVPTDGLVGWWSFTGNANDDSGHGNNGTIYGTVLCQDRYNEDSSAYYFAGSNQQIQCNNDTMLTNHMDLTLSAWFFVENRESGWQQNIIWANIGTYQASGGFQMVVGNPPNTSIQGMFRNTTFSDQVLNTTGLVSIDSNRWYQGVYTLEYFPGIDSTKASIYLNDSLINSQYFQYNISYSNIPANFTIGNNVDSIGWQRSFKGRIDDIGLWNRVLTAEEIADLFNGGGVGIKEQSDKIHLRIYPNPASEDLFISTNEKLLNYKCFNQAGQAIDVKIESNKINVSSLTNGLYILVVNYDNGSSESKIFLKY